MKLTDFPRYVSPDQYSRAIDEMVDRLKTQPDVRSIYQIGSTGVPGISDIDLLIVLKNGSEFRLDPRNDLTDTERYLFIHGLYGACERHFIASQQHTFFHNYRPLYGTQHEIGPNQVSEHGLEMLKIQTAMEYLIQMYISSTVEKAYGIARIRGLLLHAKGLLYDLEFLNIHTGRLHDLVMEAIRWRETWFTTRPEDKTIKIWYANFYDELTLFLREILNLHRFYLPRTEPIQISRNMMLRGGNFGHIHRGVTLPAWLGGLSKKYFNVQHRFNWFTFYVPVCDLDVPEILQRRFALTRDMRSYNREHFPHLMPLATSLNVA